VVCRLLSPSNKLRVAVCLFTSGSIVNSLVLQAQPYYDLYVPDSDEEYEPANSGASGMTDVEREQHPAGSALSEGGSDAGTSRLHEEAAAATAADADSTDAAAAAAAAVQETSSKSEETAVDAGAEEGGSGAAAVAAGAAAEAAGAAAAAEASAPAVKGCEGAEAAMLAAEGSQRQHQQQGEGSKENGTAANSRGQRGGSRRGVAA
jgi:hypothetical protein